MNEPSPSKEIKPPPWVPYALAAFFFVTLYLLFVQAPQQEPRYDIPYTQIAPSPHDAPAIDTTDTQTTTEPSVESSLPHEDDGGDLFWSDLSADELLSAEKIVTDYPEELCQQVIDGWSGVIKDGLITSCSPLPYLRKLVERANDGTFTFERGLSVKAERIRRLQNEAAVRAAMSQSVSATQAPADTNGEGKTNDVEEHIAALKKAVKKKLFVLGQKWDTDCPILRKSMSMNGDECQRKRTVTCCNV